MFHIVLFEPEIPQNTGNIMRTAVAIGAKVHLIEPLGFRLEEQKLKRSALDYYEHLVYEVHENYESFANKNKGTFLFLTRYGQKTHSDLDFTKLEYPIYFIFGKESTGIDKKILAKHIDQCYRIPTTDKVRSLNLSNAVAIVCFEALRQLDYPNLIKEEPESLKGKDFLNQFIEENLD
jgi:tRNA (cytidine/uridine-2'-O-)-methyltransferase